MSDRFENCETESIGPSVRCASTAGRTLEPALHASYASRCPVQRHTRQSSRQPSRVWDPRPDPDEFDVN